MYTDSRIDISRIAFSEAATHEISRIRNIEEQKLLALGNELDALETANSNHWYWREKKGKLFFWENVGGKQCGISRDLDKIHRLARRDYLRALLSNKRFDDFDKWRRKLGMLLDSHASIGLDIKRIFLTQKQYDWSCSPQSCNDFHADARKYKTNGGVIVRSKSEQSIGNMLEEFGIPYRYEPKLRIGNRIFYPDFFIITESDNKIIIEHLGRMDLRDYIQNNVDKLAAYAAAGYVIGANVFLSFEHDVRDRKSLLNFVYKIMAA